MSKRVVKDYTCGCNINRKNNKRIGTMEECTMDKKVNLYGLKKIDKLVLKNLWNESNLNNKLDKIRNQIDILYPKVKKLKNDYNNDKNESNDKELIKKSLLKFRETREKYNKLVQERDKLIKTIKKKK